MVWSYSRIKSYECPYAFFLKYISKTEKEEMFYSSYGKFMHKLIEKYYKNELSRDDMLMEFLSDFSKNVSGARPSSKIAKSYIEAGVEYIKTFTPFEYKTLAVEKFVEFDVDGIPFVGVIDYIGEKDGDIYIVDNKSKTLKPRSKRKKPTQNDEELDEMLRQLYLYSIAVKQMYGKYPKSLCFNCFRNGNFIEEPFDEEKLEEAKAWAKKRIEKIKDTDWFNPNVEFFYCRYICDVNKECCYKD